MCAAGKQTGGEGDMIGKTNTQTKKEKKTVDRQWINTNNGAACVNTQDMLLWETDAFCERRGKPNIKFH